MQIDLPLHPKYFQCFFKTLRFKKLGRFLGFEILPSSEIEDSAKPMTRLHLVNKLRLNETRICHSEWSKVE